MQVDTIKRCIFTQKNADLQRKAMTLKQEINLLHIETGTMDGLWMVHLYAQELLPMRLFILKFELMITMVRQSAFC